MPYTRDQIAKHLALLEEHLKNYQCPDCISKHLLLTEGYSEEASLFTTDEKERLKFLKLADTARAMRKELTGHAHSGCLSCSQFGEVLRHSFKRTSEPNISTHTNQKNPKNEKGEKMAIIEPEIPVRIADVTLSDAAMGSVLGTGLAAGAAFVARALAPGVAIAAPVATLALGSLLLFRPLKVAPTMSAVAGAAMVATSGAALIAHLIKRSQMAPQEAQQQVCPPGYYLGADGLTARALSWPAHCWPIGAQRGQQEICPEGYWFNPDTGLCEPIVGQREQVVCPPGTTFDPVTQQCIAIPPVEVA